MSKTKRPGELIAKGEESSFFNNTQYFTPKPLDVIVDTGDLESGSSQAPRLATVNILQMNVQNTFGIRPTMIEKSRLI